MPIAAIFAGALRHARLPVVLMLGVLLAACTNIAKPPSADAANPLGSRYASIQFARVRAAPTPATIPAKDAQGRRIYLQPLLTVPGAQVRSVRLGVDEASGRPHVDIVVSEAMGARVLALTEAMVGERLASLVDGQVLQIGILRGAFSTSFRITAESFAQASQIRSQLLAPAAARDSTH